MKNILSGFSGWSLKFKTQPINQLEFRKGFDHGNLLLIVSGDKGYTHANYSPRSKWYSTQGKNIHFSLNGPLSLTFDEFNEISTIVERAKKFIENDVQTV